ncbi:MAG: peptidoglycan bridge formation glycyltransferase FemA/FemB family protein, partial [Candidatus Levyibacteriota bacterium]
GVKVVEDNSDKAFEDYLKLTRETTQRQNFYAHSERYHRLMWGTLRSKNNEKEPKNDVLTAHLFEATYENEVLVAWIVFVLGDTLYYPYGASSNNHRETMASNLMMWEVIKFGKRLGLKKFDMWGSMSQNPDVKDPWYGFHRFKQGYGGKLVEFLGSYDLVLDKKLYILYKIANKLRWIILRFK